MLHESKHHRWGSGEPPHCGAQIVRLDVKNNVNDVTILYLQADAGRHSHISTRVLLFGALFMNNHHALGGKKRKKNFPTLEVVIRTETHTSMYVYMRVSGC